jgi:uncharacterized membrane protein
VCVVLPTRGRSGYQEQEAAMSNASPADDFAAEGGARAAFGSLLRIFVCGVLFLVPIALLVVLAMQAVKPVSQLLQPVATMIPAETIAGVVLVELVAVLIVVLFLLVGIFAGMRLGRALGDRLEQLVLRRIPGFTLIKSITHGMVGMQSGGDVCAALAWIEESWVLAFAMERHDNGLYTVFVPSAPAPAARAIYYLPEDRIRILDVPVSSAAGCVTRLGLGSRDLLAREFAQRPTLQPAPVEAGECRQ